MYDVPAPCSAAFDASAKTYAHVSSKKIGWGTIGVITTRLNVLLTTSLPIKGFPSPSFVSRAIVREEPPNRSRLYIAERLSQNSIRILQKRFECQIFQSLRKVEQKHHTGMTSDQMQGSTCNTEVEKRSW